MHYTKYNSEPRKQHYLVYWSSASNGTIRLPSTWRIEVQLSIAATQFQYASAVVHHLMYWSAASIGSNTTTACLSSSMFCCCFVWCFVVVLFDVYVAARCHAAARRCCPPLRTSNLMCESEGSPLAPQEGGGAEDQGRREDPAGGHHTSIPFFLSLGRSGTQRSRSRTATQTPSRFQRPQSGLQARQRLQLPFEPDRVHSATRVGTQCSPKSLRGAPEKQSWLNAEPFCPEPLKVS